MITRKLWFKIASCVALCVFLIEGIFAYLEVSNQRQVLFKRQIQSVLTTTRALSPEFARDIKNEKFNALSQLVSELTDQYGIYAFTLFDPQGKVYAPIEWDLTKPLEGQPEGLDERITAGSL